MLTKRRKEWIRFFVVLIVTSLIFSACATPTAEVIEKVVTQVVQEKVVETVIVEGTPQVVEREVTRVVQVEKEVTPTPLPQREVFISFSNDTSTLDPHTSAGPVPVMVFTHMFDKLVERDARTMNIVPDLAESWEIVDETTYVFHLREGVRFHNGEELTASDVKFSFERMANPDPYFKSLFKYVDPLVESVEIIDDYTVQINLKTAYAPFLRRMPTFFIVPEDYITQVGDEEFAAHPIGSGPYKFIEWVKDDHLSFEANKDYWKGAPAIERVTWRPIPQASTRVAALLAGEVDLIEQAPVESIPMLLADPNVRVLPHEDNKIYFFIMNPNNPPFDNVLVRRAVSHAVDWDTTLQLLEGYGFRTPLPGLASDFGYLENEDDLMPYAYFYDPDKVRALLAEAGYPDGFMTTLQTTTGMWPKSVEICQAVAAQLGEFGIEVEIEVLERSLYGAEAYSNAQCKGICIYVMGNPLFDPDHLMTVHFHSETQHGGYYHSPELDELIVRGKSTTDDDERVEIYRQAMQRLLEEAPFIWAFGYKQIWAARADIEWIPRADVRVFADEMSFR